VLTQVKALRRIRRPFLRVGRRFLALMSVNRRFCEFLAGNCALLRPPARVRLLTFGEGLRDPVSPPRP